MDNSKIIQGLMRVNEISDDDLYNLIKFDIENGITFFDLADCYSNGLVEEKLGRVLKNNPSLREKMFIQTKCSITRDKTRGTYYDLSYKHIIESVNNSLNRMQIDYIDCLLLHRPDIFMDNKEIAKAFKELKTCGKVHYFGVSNFSKEMIEYLNEELEDKIVIDQVQLGLGHTRLLEEGLNFNMINNEGISYTNDTYFYLKRKNIILQAWSPFLVGFFEGSIFDKIKYPQINTKLDDLARKYSTSKCAIATSFLLTLGDNIRVITGAIKQNHIKECLDGINIKLEKPDWYDLYKSVGKMLP